MIPAHKPGQARSSNRAPQGKRAPTRRCPHRLFSPPPFLPCRFSGGLDRAVRCLPHSGSTTRPRRPGHRAAIRPTCRLARTRAPRRPAARPSTRRLIIPELGTAPAAHDLGLLLGGALSQGGRCLNLRRPPVAHGERSRGANQRLVPRSRSASSDPCSPEMPQHVVLRRAIPTRRLRPGFDIWVMSRARAVSRVSSDRLCASSRSWLAAECPAGTWVSQASRSQIRSHQDRWIVRRGVPPAVPLGYKNPNGYCGLGGTGVSCPIGIAKLGD
jgi:hypothetical protein